MTELTSGSVSPDRFLELASILLDRLEGRMGESDRQSCIIDKDCGEEDLMLDLLAASVFVEKIALHEDEWEILRELLYYRENLDEDDQEWHPFICRRDEILKGVVIIDSV